MRKRTMGEMIQDQQPLMLGPDAKVSEACAAMYRRRVGAVMIVEHGDRLTGIFTGRDAVRCLAVGLDAKHTTLRQVMTAPCTTVTPDHHAMDALRLLNDCGFRHLPVCRDGRVIGIVSRYDFRAMEQGRMNEESGLFEMIR